MFDSWVFSFNYFFFVFQNMILIEGRCPSVFSHVWVLDPEKQMWSKGFLLLRDKKVYLSYKLAVVAKFLRSGKVRDSTYFPVSCYFCIGHRLSWNSQHTYALKRFFSKTRSNNFIFSSNITICRWHEMKHSAHNLTFRKVLHDAFALS